MDEQASAARERSERRPWSPLDPVIAAAFWTLAVVILVNPRGLFPPGDNTGTLVFAGLRVLCCLLLLGLVHVRLPQALGKSGAWLLGSMASYLVIGFFVSVATDAELLVHVSGFDLYDFVSYPVIACILVLSAALGAYAALERVGMRAFLRSMLLVLTASSALVVLTPVLRRMGVLLTWHFYETLETTRFVGTFWDPNISGFVGCLTAVLALAFLGNVRRPVLAYLAMSIGFFAVAGSLSKTAIVTMGVILAFFLLLNGRRGRGRILLRLGAIALAIALMGVLVFQKLNPIYLVLQSRTAMTRILDILDLVTGRRLDEQVLSNRGYIWTTGLRHSLESPLVGQGLGRLHIMDDAPFSPWQQVNVGVHNMYLLLLGEAGILPLGLYLLYLFSLLRLRWAAPKSLSRDAIVGWTIAVFLQGMTGHQIFVLGAYSFLAGVTCAMASYAARGSGGRTGETPRTFARTHAAPSATG